MKRFFICCCLLLPILMLSAQSLMQPLNQWMAQYELQYPTMGRLRVNDVKVNARAKTIEVFGNIGFQYVPFRPALVEQMLHQLDSIVKPQYPGYKVNLYADNVNVWDLIPNYYRTDLDHSKLPRGTQHSEGFVVDLSQPYQVSSGLANRHIALWQSHGWYYDQKSDRWRWQRARLFETVEDKLTLSFILPYLVPMLENAGAYVWMPRERDVQTHEVVVDNDGSWGQSEYREVPQGGAFQQGGNAGFAAKREYYVEGQNPFTEGTYRTMAGSRHGEERMEWIPDIPETGEYAVSIAYRTVHNGTKAAHYTVHHLGGTTTFTVNQTMGGGTWVYLGTFKFAKGKQADRGSVVLTNASEKHGTVVVGDAVRFGGGMGNVGRRPADAITMATVRPGMHRHSKMVSIFTREDYQTSQRPRYLEGARYWLQWAGVPDSVYCYTGGTNDYTDDFSSRGAWVNWLARGSQLMPDSAGLNVPVELSLAFHTDAGFKPNKMIGTLGIYTSDSGDKSLGQSFPNKQSRTASRDLVDLITSSIVNDVRTLYEPNWPYRGMWNKNYSETRRPEVPSMILELLSHQNYEDMLYGLDPNFRFTVARAIYKGMLRFVATQHQCSYTVQPLPVTHLSASFEKEGVRLNWHPQTDVLEPTAKPTGYVVYSRTADGGFDNGVYVNDTTAWLPLESNVAMSYRVAAVNHGGRSMLSETMSVCRVDHAKEVVLIVNGFTRVCAPQGFSVEGWCGFPEWTDRGVADGYNLSYVGRQYAYGNNEKWTDDDDPGIGASSGDYETRRVAGNSFDYPYLHGNAMVHAGYSYVSTSVAAVESGQVKLTDYRYVDMILGEQRQTVLGRDSSHWEYKTFSLHLQALIRRYCQQGGSLLVSGAYVGSDLFHGPISGPADEAFARDVLHITCRTQHACRRGEVSWVYSPIEEHKGTFRFATEVNDSINAIESADGIEPAAKPAYSVMRYNENNISAAVGYSGKYNSIVLGYPFESVIEEKDRNRLMRQMLEFLTRP